MLRYQRILGAFLGFYAPVEGRLPALLGPAPELGVPFPDRARLLAADLVATGLSPAEVRRNPACADLPSLQNVEQAAGCLYVLEGAALGGRIVSVALQRNLGLDARNGASFFAPGPDTGRRFRRIVHWLDELVRGRADADAIVKGANHTFTALETWLANNGAAT